MPDQAPKLDLITLILNYHDITYLPVDRAKMDERLYGALKPGGHLVVVDHSAKPGTGTSVGKTLHRIDEALVRELVLDPLGMDHSFFFADEAIIYQAAVGHEAVFGKRRTPKVLRPWPIARSGNAVGGLNSTILDLLRYARFHMGSGKSEKGKQVLKPENLKLMQTPIHDAANDEQIGISWFLKDIDGVRILRHGGATNGQMAVLVIVPEKQFAFTMLTNSDRGSDLYGPLMNWALKAYLGLAMPEPQPLRAKRKEQYDCNARNNYIVSKQRPENEPSSFQGIRHGRERQT